MTPSATTDMLQVLGYLYLRFGQHRRALALLQIAAREAPDDPGVLRSLAYALVLNKAPEEALAVLEKLTSLEPSSRQAARLLESRALLLQGRISEAQRSFRQFVDLQARQRPSEDLPPAGAEQASRGWSA